MAAGVRPAELRIPSNDPDSPHAAELLGRQEAQALLDHLGKSAPKLVEDLVPKMLTLSTVQKVLQNLLRERVSIRNMITILECLASYSDYTKDTGMLTEYVRVALARQICRDYMDRENTLSVITVDPEIESVIRSSIHDDPVEGRVVGLDPDTHSSIMKSLLNAYTKVKSQGYAPVFLVSPHIRSVTYSLLQRELHDPVVLSYNEVVSSVKVNVVFSAMVSAAA